MTIWFGSGERRSFAAFAAMLYILLVSMTMSLPHRHADGLPPVNAVTHHTTTGIATDSTLCPICEWMGSSYLSTPRSLSPTSATVVVWHPAVFRILVRSFGLVEPGHTPQRGPPSFGLSV